jgi:hypothetical protein
MNKSPRPKPPWRSLTISILGAVACFLLFAYGILTGGAMVPARYVAQDISLQNHPFLFWLTEAFWLLLAIAAAFVAFEHAHELQRPAPAPAKPVPTSIPVPAKPKPANLNAPELRSTSPTGRYLVNILHEEMRMSHWIEIPALLDTSTGQILFSPRDNIWSLASAVWKSESVVTMQLMKYPDGRVKIEATFDCASFTASIGAIAVADFRNSATAQKALDQAYDAASSKAGA